MIKIDMHSHTSGVSFCSEVAPSAYAKAYSETDVKTVVLTNHYSRIYMFRYGQTFDEQMKVYLSEYHKTQKECESKGINVILGAEVAISTPQSPYIEFLLYGADEPFFWQHPNLYDCSQSELYKICNDNGVLMFQSHPFRVEHGHVPMDPEFMDGTEVNNHPYFFRSEDKIMEFANKNNLMVICGSDFHYLRQAGTAAIYADDNITNSKQLANFLRANPRPKLFYK